MCSYVWLCVCDLLCVRMCGCVCVTMCSHCTGQRMCFSVQIGLSTIPMYYSAHTKPLAASDNLSPFLTVAVVVYLLLLLLCILQIIVQIMKIGF